MTSARSFCFLLFGRCSSEKVQIFPSRCGEARVKGPLVKKLNAFALLLFSEHCNDFWDEQGEDEKSYREKDFEGDEIFPVAAGPNLLKGTDEESEDKGSYDDA
jgi:hypothetical protein